MLPVTIHVPVPGSYNSVLLKLALPSVPPATSTLPLGSNVARSDAHTSHLLPLTNHVPLLRPPLSHASSAPPLHAPVPISPPHPPPCHWAATSPCDPRVRCPCCRSPSTFLFQDHTAPLSLNYALPIFPPPPAPCHWAATW